MLKLIKYLKSAVTVVVERLQEAEAERSKLNEAVIQQQRYIASLQAHYQKWVHDATLKFEELQIKQETKSSCGE